MTQREALITVLSQLGGRGELKEIYPRVVELVQFKEGSDAKATIRNCLQTNPKDFRPSSNMRGTWELISFQEELYSRDKLIVQLVAENEMLKGQETGDMFASRFVNAMINLFKRESSVIDDIRKIFIAMGEEDIANNIDRELDNKEKHNLSANTNTGIMAAGNVTMANPEIRLTDAQVKMLIEERKKLKP